MPTILELFKGSNKDINPKILDQTPVEDKFKGSTQEKSVKSDQLSKVEQEFKGVRFRSGVELNNPLIYGNQAIRIATRSTSSVEKMKDATGGSAGDGGLIGKGLGKITEGKFGKFVFGGKVTSLNQARDGVNSRLGIPPNLIPTNVYNTGDLQKGLEPDTMITLSKIKNDNKGTLVGKFLKQTGGGNPKTLGTQILGQGISLVKDKLRTTLFGNPNSLGANGAQASVTWEYSSTLPYSKQISNVKFNSKTVNGIEESASTNITKKITQVQLDAKKKLGQAASNATALLKKNLKGTESTAEIDKVVESKTKKTTATASTYSEKLDGYRTEDVTERIDLSLVSPIKGIDRKETKGVFGKSEYAFFDVKNPTGAVMPNDPTRTYTSNRSFGTLENKYGLTSNKGDSVNGIFDAGPNTKNRDLIPIQMKGISDKTSEWVAFRAIMTGFTETISPSWDGSKFVGNPYNYYTYSGVERSANFSLKFYCMNVAELDIMWKKINWLSKKAYPTISANRLVNAPFIKLTLGSIYQDKVGFINSLSYTIADDITWETAANHWLPKIVDVQLEFKIVEWVGNEDKLYGENLSKEATKAINNKRAGSTQMVSQDPVTTPATATTSNTTTPATTPSTPVVKIDSKGVEQTTPPTQPTQTTAPKSLDTGKPAETPKQASDPATLTAIAISSQTKFAEDKEKAEKKYVGKGYPDWLCSVLANNEASGTKISNITKIDENAYYMDKEYEDDGLYEQVHYKNGNAVSLMSYEKWVTKHDGKDPMNKFFKTNSSSGKLQTATPF
jgi:hypothetical protein